MDALPSLHGSIGYIFTSCELDVQNSRNVQLKDMVERFKVYSQPRQPEGKEPEWLAGERVDTKGACVVRRGVSSLADEMRPVRLPTLRPTVRPFW